MRLRRNNLILDDLVPRLIMRPYVWSLPETRVYPDTVSPSHTTTYRPPRQEKSHRSGPDPCCGGLSELPSQVHSNT